MSAYEEELITEHQKEPETKEEQQFSFKEAGSSDDNSSLKKGQDRHVINLANEEQEDNGENNSEEEKQVEEKFQFKESPSVEGENMFDMPPAEGSVSPHPNDDVSELDKSERMIAINNNNLSESAKMEGAAPSVHQAFAPSAFQAQENAKESEDDKMCEEPEEE